MNENRLVITMPGSATILSREEMKSYLKEVSDFADRLKPLGFRVRPEFPELSDIDEPLPDTIHQAVCEYAAETSKELDSLKIGHNGVSVLLIAEGGMIEMARGLFAGSKILQ